MDLSLTNDAPIHFLTLMFTLMITGLKWFYGGYFIVFGWNGLRPFLPDPPQSEGLKAYLVKLDRIPHFFTMIKSLEILAGVLLFGPWFWTTLVGILLLTPVVIGIIYCQVRYNWQNGKNVIFLISIIHGILILDIFIRLF